ncbi:MAG: substrate-binding domain-containing protein [Anaerolineae bacterium]|nr:substrate-binding domain-containing protein [Anaerolineae bacterium]
MIRKIFPGRAIASLLVAVLMLVGCGQGQQQDTISISGAFALYPLMVRWAEEYQVAHPDIRIDVSAGGAGKGMADALSEMVNIGMVSREIRLEEETQGAYAIAVTKDAVFPVVNAQNPVLGDLQIKGVTRETFGAIYLTGEITNWGQVVGTPDQIDSINVYTRSDSCGAAEMWVKYLGGGAQEDLLGIGVSGDPGELEAVAKDPLGIGYNNLNYAFDAATGQPVAGVVIVPIDVNGNGQVDETERLDTKDMAIQAVASGAYPSPPARPLYLVTKGQPSGATLDFIRWILSEGQAFIPEVGYIQLTEDQLAVEQAKLP